MDQLHIKIQSKLESCSSISVICDIWSNKRNEAYIGIAANLSDSFLRQTIILGLMKIDGPHSAENIKIHIEKVLNRYEFEVQDQYFCFGWWL
jgi:hypothetical protein